MRSSGRRDRQPSARWTVRHDRTQGDERGTSGTRGRRTRWKAGCPTGREAHGHGAAVVVAGVTTGQGARESRAQGEGQQGSGVPVQGGTRNAARRNCPSTHLREQAVTLESRMPGNGHVRFGGGPTEKGWATSTSRAAYPTGSRCG